MVIEQQRRMSFNSLMMALAAIRAIKKPEQVRLFQTTLERP
jgi:hypothetical protein